MDSKNILFRGKSKKTGEWLYGSLINNVFYHPRTGKPNNYILDTSKFDRCGISKSIVNALEDNEVNPETVGKYTEFKINDKKIFHGDVLERVVTVVLYDSDVPPEEVKDRVLVEYRSDYGGFYVGEEPLFGYLYSSFDRATGCKCTEAKIIGNIYDNPRLLEIDEDTNTYVE